MHVMLQLMFDDNAQESAEVTGSLLKMASDKGWKTSSFCICFSIHKCNHYKIISLVILELVK